MDEIKEHFASVAGSLEEIDIRELGRAVGLLREAKNNNARVWIIGNGGSAATASHFANDLIKMCGVKAFALPDMTPTMMAYGNDDGWDIMFLNMLNVLVGPIDVLVAISCSGRSPNVVYAAERINRTIALTGMDANDNILGGSNVPVCIYVPDKDITIQEDAHLAICHAITKALRE